MKTKVSYSNLNHRIREEPGNMEGILIFTVLGCIISKWTGRFLFAYLVIYLMPYEYFITHKKREQCLLIRAFRKNSICCSIYHRNHVQKYTTAQGFILRTVCKIYIFLKIHFNDQLYLFTWRVVFFFFPFPLLRRLRRTL